MNSHKQDFLSDVIFGITLMGTAQRGKLYRDDSTSDERNKFRLALRAALESLTEKYRTHVTDARHFTNIDNLAQTLSEQYPEALNSSRFRIGSAQKALNLYLKLSWCLDRIPTPPHCPFDAIVLSHVPGCERVRWTQLDSLSDYARVVDCAKAVADGVSLAEWELRLYTAVLSAGRAANVG